MVRDCDQICNRSVDLSAEKLYLFDIKQVLQVSCCLTIEYAIFIWCGVVGAFLDYIRVSAVVRSMEICTKLRGCLMVT